MHSPRLAGRYAKSLLTLAIERNQLEAAYKDMEYLQAVSNSNKDFVTVLKSPVISPDKKQLIIKSVTDGKISELTSSFISLLIRKGREINLPEIADTFISQYKEVKEIHIAKLTTATPVSEEVKQEIVDQVKRQLNITNIELISEVDENLLGGFVLQIGDKLVDASIAYDLNIIRKQFLNNDFIYKVR
jgi:F-type H+-transporting ATPase subunit delta